MRIPQLVLQRLDRRRFLLGAGGAVLALPMLEAHAPRVAFAQAAAPPQRLVVVLHGHGRVCGGNTDSGAPEDSWSPLKATGALPSTGELSPLLAALGDVRKEIVTVDAVDNLVRHMTGDADGHASAVLSCLTCAVPPAGLVKAAGPSFDYVAGQRLRASASQRSNILFPSSPVPNFITDSERFFGADGTAPALMNLPPGDAAAALFASVDSGGGAPPPPTKKTLADRLAARRPSILDAVAKSFMTVRSQVGAADRERLDQHAAFLQSLEAQLSGGGPTVPLQACSPPDVSKIPTPDEYADHDHDWTRGFEEATMWKYQVENLVQSLACDVTRVAGLQFLLDYCPVFPSEFSGASPFDGDNNWHASIHDTDLLSRPWAPDLTTAFQFYNKVFAYLIQRLAAIADTDGSRLLDNTLVVWVSDLGYGSAHHNFNIPVVLSGMGSKFGHGQGRHVVCDGRRSLGDLYAQMLRMLGGDDQTFGAIGKVGDTGLKGDKLMPQNGAPGFISTSTPLHLGELDL